MSDFTAITTQEELDTIVKARLAREKEKYADYDQLKTRVSDLEKENGALKSAAETSKWLVMRQQACVLVLLCKMVCQLTLRIDCKETMRRA